MSEQDIPNGFEIHRQKDELRALYKEKRKALTPEFRHAADERLCRQFCDSMTYRCAKMLFVYAPLPREIDIMPIVSRAWRDGKVTAFPRCSTETCTMDFYAVSSEEDLLEGYCHIREPKPGLTPCLPCAGDHPVCLVPGLVFDRDGYRVGYGKGYYDRFLADFPGVSVGVVYSENVLGRVPRGRYDLPAGALLTEKGVFTVHAV